MADRQPDPPNSAPNRAFARKVRLSKWALVFERLWPRLWLFLGLAALFLILSFAGLWPHLGELTHQITLGAFALAGLAALIYAARVPWPSREEAVRRIERRSGVPHRPATSYEDTLTANTDNPETKALWQAHRDRLQRAIKRLRVGTPAPRTDRFDPLALRTLALLVLVPAAALVTGSLSDRLMSAFRIGAVGTGANTRVDAWVTPPPYTGLPPVMLADGADTSGKSAADKKLVEIPEHSLLTLRGLGFGPSGLSLEILSDGAKEPQRVHSEAPKAGGVEKADIAEVRADLTKPALVRAFSGSRRIGEWTFDVTPDETPKITLDNEMNRTPRGSMKLSYKATDDYGVASAQVKVKQIPPKPVDAKKAWAAREQLKGPRLPLERPPVMPLKLSRPGGKAVDGSTLLDFGAHPWAGQKVQLWLEATDVAGKTGKSEPVEMVLPARQFRKPLARAVIEQRRKLAEDSRNRPYVVRALDALMLEPEGFIDEAAIYLGLKSVRHRLERENTRRVISESIDQLWHIALRIEDGALSDAERALKDAQDKLSEALQKDTSDEELQALIDDLKRKLNDYLQEMQKQAEKDPQNGGEEPGDDQQELGQQDLEQMLNDLEKNAKNGSREEAEKMLSELRELMDRLQAETKESRAENQRAKEMMKKLNQLSDLTGKQQQLMDETFKEQRKRSGAENPGGTQDDPNGDPNSGQGQKGMTGQGQQRAERGSPQAGQGGGSEEGQGMQGERGKGPGQRQQGGEGNLRDRQAQLEQELERLQKELDEMGIGDPDKLGKARDAMGQAKDALEQGDMEEATEQQAEALDQMRQSAQQMAQQIQKNAQQRMGRGGDSPRDPLGRPQRAQGPDQGNSVKVPDAIDAQRAREILDELRKRAGQNMRPPLELDYIDRLLRRF